MKYLNTQERFLFNKNIEISKEKRQEDMVSDREKFVNKYLKNNDFIINYDLSVDVNGDVNMKGNNDWTHDMKSLPFKFNRVNGNLNIMLNQLVDLRLCPNEVTGNFNCSYNHLKTLKGGPIRVGGNYEVISKGHLSTSEFALSTLEGCPKQIGGDFDINGNNIYTFEYFPEHLGGNLKAENNPIYCIWSLFIDKSKIEVFNEYDPIRPPEEGRVYKDYYKESKPILYLDVLEQFFNNEINKSKIDKSTSILYTQKINLYYNIINMNGNKADLSKFINSFLVK